MSNFQFPMSNQIQSSNDKLDILILKFDIDLTLEIWILTLIATCLYTLV